MPHLFLSWILQCRLADLSSNCTLTTSVSYYCISSKVEVEILVTQMNIVSKNQGIQTACPDRSGLLSPLLLSVLSPLAYLSI